MASAMTVACMAHLGLFRQSFGDSAAASGRDRRAGKDQRFNLGKRR
jgi:hypothetical protein